MYAYKYGMIYDGDSKGDLLMIMVVTNNDNLWRDSERLIENVNYENSLEQSTIVEK